MRGRSRSGGRVKVRAGARALCICSTAAKRRCDVFQIGRTGQGGRWAGSSSLLDLRGLMKDEATRRTGLILFVPRRGGGRQNKAHLGSVRGHPLLMQRQLCHRRVGCARVTGEPTDARLIWICKNRGGDLQMLVKPFVPTSGVVSPVSNSVAPSIIPTLMGGIDGIMQAKRGDERYVFRLAAQTGKSRRAWQRNHPHCKRATVLYSRSRRALCRT